MGSQDKEKGFLDKAKDAAKGAATAGAIGAAVVSSGTTGISDTKDLARDYKAVAESQARGYGEKASKDAGRNNQTSGQGR